MISPIRWEQCNDDFEFDGSWRDIYILNTNSEDWNRFLKSLLHSKYKTIFWIDGEAVKPIKTIQRALEIRNQANPLMCINASGVHIACHFFTDEEMEFDLDPREVNNQQDLDNVLNFIIFLGNLLEKKVILTPENISSTIIIEFDPKKQSMVYYDLKYP